MPKNPSNTALVVKNGRTVEVVNVTDEQTNISLDSWCVKIRTRPLRGDAWFVDLGSVGDFLGTAEDASDYSTLLAVAADVVNLRNEILSSL